MVLTGLGGLTAGILIFLLVLAITGPKSAEQSQRARFKVGSAERLAGVARNAEDRLRRLAAQLNEAVARAVELSLKDTDLGTLQPLGSDVDSLVDELESLRVALDETTR